MTKKIKYEGSGKIYIKLCQTPMFSYFIRTLVMETECRKKTTSLGDDALIALIAVIDIQLGYRQIVFR